MNRDELLEIKGGGASAAMLNAIVRIATILLEIGRALGSAITRTTKKISC